MKTVNNYKLTYKIPITLTNTLYAIALGGVCVTLGRTPTPSVLATYGLLTKCISLKMVPLEPVKEEINLNKNYQNKQMKEFVRWINDN